MRSLRLIAGLLGMLTLPAVASEAVQSLDRIQKQVKEFLLAQHAGQAELSEIRVGQLDSRLRLVQCGMALEIFQPNSARPLGNNTVGVRCPGPQPWTVYLSATVRSFAQVLVAARPLPQGTILSTSDFTAERRDLTTLSGSYETASEHLIGKQLRRSLPTGAVISPQALVTPALIKRGQKVFIVAHEGGMEVSSSGVALSDAALGERLQVRNDSSQRVIEGKVVAAQRIEVGM